MLPNIERLEKLANHLLYGTLGHEHFDFSQYNGISSMFKVSKWGTYSTNGCGTMGCAIGECPIIWPSDWFFINETFSHDPRLTVNPQRFTFRAVQDWFNISASTVEYLFLPNKRSKLDVSATKEQVAENILKYCEQFK